MVLGKLPVPGRPTILITVGQGPIALAVGAGGGGLDIFTLIYHFSPLSPSLWETARYRLKYCLKGPLNPTQPTNQPTRKRKSSKNAFLQLFTVQKPVGPKWYIQSLKAIDPLVMERHKIFKGFTMYGNGGYLGHVTWTKYVCVLFVAMFVIDILFLMLRLAR